MTEYLFSPPPGKDLIPFQEEGIISAHHILTDEQGDQAVDLQYEMGLGKSVVSMALAGLLFEDDLIDHVLVVAEAIADAAVGQYSVDIHDHDLDIMHLG